MIPKLQSAALQASLELEQKLLHAEAAIERWFRLQWMEHTPPFYSSVDVRNAGFKVAPVDTNLFPGGFNNLAQDMLPLAVQAAMLAVERGCPEARNLLLIPERHTRNMFYLENVARLMDIFGHAGLNVRLGTLDESLKQPLSVKLPSGRHITFEPLVRGERRLGLEGFDPCTILLNNDLSAGVPAVLQNLHEQTLLPPLHAGWVTRRKSTHFAAYEDMAKQFAKQFGFDPWLINPYFETCSEIDFSAGVGFECLQAQVHALLTRIRRKYREYQIEQEPFVVIKADAGTYGMGIMTVRDAAELQSLNRKTRNKMSVVKEGLAVSQAILQEGVPTCERINEASAEPVVYMIDRFVVGGFYRVHPDRGAEENLNAPGMELKPLPFDEPFHLTNLHAKPGESGPNRFYMYGVIARLAMAAASLELERTDPQREALESYP